MTRDASTYKRNCSNTNGKRPGRQFHAPAGDKKQSPNDASGTPAGDRVGSVQARITPMLNRSYPTATAGTAVPNLTEQAFCAGSKPRRRTAGLSPLLATIGNGVHNAVVQSGLRGYLQRNGVLFRFNFLPAAGQGFAQRLKVSGFDAPTIRRQRWPCCGSGGTPTGRRFADGRPPSHDG